MILIAAVEEEIPETPKNPVNFDIACKSVIKQCLVLLFVIPPAEYVCDFAMRNAKQCLDTVANRAQKLVEFMTLNEKWVVEPNTLDIKCHSTAFVNAMQVQQQRGEV